jgi:hypothetical protein
MIKFVKGQWYQKKTTKEYYQCIDKEQWLYDETTKECRQIIDIKHNVLMVCRRAGQDTHIIAVGDANDYTHVSLNPDFSNANVGDECFSPILSHCQIANIDGNWEIYCDTNRFDVSEIYVKQKHTNNYMYYYPPRRGHHPSLYNSFAQFQAYWAEQALLMATQRRNHE